MPRRRRRDVARRAGPPSAARPLRVRAGGRCDERSRRERSPRPRARAGDPPGPPGQRRCRCAPWRPAVGSASRSSAPSSGACRCPRSPRSTASPRRSTSPRPRCCRCRRAATSRSCGPTEGRMVPSSERPGSAIGRLVFADEHQGLEVFEYVMDAAADLDVWYAHDGRKVLHLVERPAHRRVRGPPAEHLGPGRLPRAHRPDPAPLDGDRPGHGAAVPRHRARPGLSASVSG